MANLQDSDSERLNRIEGMVEWLVVTVEKIARDQAEMKAELSEVKAEQAEMKAEQVRMRADIDRMSADIDRLTQGYDMLSQGFARLSQDFAKMSQDVGVMKGWQTELVVERRADRVFRQLCQGGRLLRIYPDDELRHYVWGARNAGSITEQEFDQAGSVDFLLEGTDGEGAAVMYAVEVSFSVGAGDSERAVGKAALLSRVLGRDVRPGVAGESPSVGFEDDARARGVAYAYIGNGRDIVR